MSKQTTLAEAIAIIIGLNATVLLAPDHTVRNPRETDPNVVSAKRIWNELLPSIRESVELKETVFVLAQSPSEEARHELEIQLVELFQKHPNLRDRVDNLIQQSEYASLLSASQFTPPHSRMPVAPTYDRETAQYRIYFVLMLVAFLGLSGIISALELSWLVLALIPVRAGIVGYLAHKLRIKHPAWMGVAALLPTLLVMTIVVLGYRRGRTDLGEPEVYYSSITKVFGGLFGSLPLMLFIFILVTNASYLGYLFSGFLGYVLMGVGLVAYAIVIFTLWYSFWKNMARGGLGISIAALIISLLTFIPFWVILLGPAFLRILQVFS